jgi:hypothetical protein
MTATKKPCVNCTCATTGFCPRGVGANIPAAAEKSTPVKPNQALREQLRHLPGNRRRMRY